MPTFGHGSVHERIRIVSEEILANPEAPSLYVKRAHLFLEDGVIEKAILDLGSAIEKGGEEYPPALMCYAELYQQIGSHDAALEYIDRFLDLQQIHTTGFGIRADILVSMGKTPSALNYYKKIVIHTPTLSPENYYDIIDLLIKEVWLDEALFYCREAKRKLGPLLVLDEKIVHIHTLSPNYEEAISHLD
ncbi:MAG: hypothetical protein GY751_21990 [Bacteroidetes bacterium]|nr:hypothetical protein [Bacteroidota bacterium]